MKQMVTNVNEIKEKLDSITEIIRLFLHGRVNIDNINRRKKLID